MKKTSILLFLAVLSFFVGLFLSCDNSKLTILENEYHASVGEIFTLPEWKGVSIRVYDEDGNEISINNGQFFLAKEQTVKIVAEKGKQKQESKLIVRDDSAPSISVESNFKYIPAGETPLPVVKISDEYNAKELIPEYSVFCDGASVEIQDGQFYAENSKTYRVDISCTDGKNVNRTSVLYEATDDEKRWNAVTSFENPYGLCQVNNNVSGNLSYTTEKSYGDEKGSLKIEITSETQLAGNFSVKNAIIKDISESESLYFYVYNDGNTNLDFYVNWSTYVKLYSNTWTLVKVKDYTKSAENSGNSLISNDFTSKDINGMLFSYYEYGANGLLGLGERNLYFSNIYMLPEKTAEEVKEKVEVLPELFGKQETAKLTAQCDYIENLYANLSEEEKETVDNYQKLSVTRSKILAIENDVEIEENKVIYFDSVLGEKQVNASLSAGNMNDSVKKSTDYEIKNLDEKASTKISLNVDGACDLKITFLSPMLINLTENQGLGLYVYTEKENLVAWMDDTSWNNNHLSVGQWTFVYVRDLSYIKNNGLINYSFNIVSPGTGDRPNWSLPQGKYDVYLSSVFVFDKGYADSLLKQEKTDANMLSIAADIYSALNIPQTDIFGTTFNQLLNQISSDSGKEELKNLIDLSDKITTEKNEEKLESIKIRYFELVYGLTYQKNTMVYSGSEYGLSQIQLNVLADTQSGYNAGDFSVGISDEKKYNNKPTLKLDIKNTQGYQIDLTITNSMLKDISEYSSISFYVYTEEDDYVAVGEKTLSSWENNRLTPRKWNKVVINNFDNLSAGSKTNIDGFKMMFVWYRSWAKLHSNTTFYISDIIAEK